MGWHDGELLVQRRSGVTDHERLRRGVRQALPPHFIDFVSCQGFVIVAALDGRGRPWCFAIFGEPGLMIARDSTTILMRRDAFLESAPMEVLAGGGPIGLLVFDPSSRRRVRINGHSTIDRHFIQITVQETFGNCQQYVQKRPSDYARRHLTTSPVPLPLSADLRARIRNADTCFLATGSLTAGLDASHRGGKPGFVEWVDDDAVCRFVDYAGNNMFQSLGNIAVNPMAAMLFPDFSTGDVLLLSGHASLEWLDDGGQGARRIRFEPVVAFDQRPDRPWTWPVIEPSPLNP